MPHPARLQPGRSARHHDGSHVEHGHRLGIAAPINEAILDIAQRIEESSLEPSPTNTLLLIDALIASETATAAL